MPVACQRCGHENEPSEHFCASCGAFLGWGGEAPAGTEPAGGGTTQLGSPAPTPDDQHAGVQIRLEADQIEVAPGGQASAAFAVRNQGTQVEEFLLAVAGPDWLTVDPSTVSVFPGQEATGTLQAAPPRTPGSTAGVQPFRLTATSAIHPQLASSTGGQVDVAPFYELNAELVPTTSTGRGWTRHHVILGNRGNVSLRILLSPADVTDGLRLSMPPAAQVEPGQVAEVPVAVQARRVWLGRPEPKPFSLTAEPPRPLAPARMSGTRTIVPVFPRWVPAVAGIAVAAVAIGAVAAAKLHHHGPPISAGTPTASVSSTSASSPTPSASPSASPSTSPSTSPTPTVPSVAGQALSQANSALSAQNLTPVPVATYDTSVTAGNVVGTNPAAGAPLPSNGQIQVLVSTGIDSLVSLASSATWTSNSPGPGTSLTYGGSASDTGGAAFAPASPVTMEDNSTPQASQVVQTDPPNQDGGVVTGTFTLTHPIIKGERFRASIGFPQGTTGTISYSVSVMENGTPQTVDPGGQHTEDGTLVSINDSLNNFVNATQLILSVTAVSPSGIDQVVWVNPRVEPANAPPS